MVVVVVVTVKTKALARKEDTLVATRCLLTGLRQVRGGEGKGQREG